MYVLKAAGLGQSGRDKPTEEDFLRAIRVNGLRFQVELAGKMRDILLAPGITDSPYISSGHPESQAYWALSKDERAKVAATVNQIFQQATTIQRKLDQKNPRDKPWVRIWLNLRDFVMRIRADKITPPARVWYTEPLPASEYPRFEKAIKDLEARAKATQDSRRRRYLCWINKLKNPGTDDRIIGWSKICPKTSGAVGAAFVVGPCDITQGMPVDQAELERRIRSIADVETANKSMHFITYMRSAIVVAYELTALPLENLRKYTDDAGQAVEKLDQWANAPMGGSSAMPAGYRAIKDWIMRGQKDPKSLYSCF